MGHAAQIRHMVAETAQKLGGVDILVNNAQGFGTRETPMRANPPTPLETFSEAEWDWVFDTGLKGTLIAMQEVFPHMKARGGGAIITFGSMRCTITPPFNPASNAAQDRLQNRREKWRQR